MVFFPEFECPRRVTVLERVFDPLCAIADDAKLLRRVVLEENFGGRQEFRPAGAGQNGQVELTSLDVGLRETGRSFQPLPDQVRISFDERVIRQSAGGVFPDGFDQVAVFRSDVPEIVTGFQPRRRRHAFLGQHSLGKNLAGREEHCVGLRAGIGDIEFLQQQRAERNHPSAAVDRLHQVKHQIRLLTEEFLFCRLKIQRKGERDRLMAKFAQRGRDRIDLNEDVLFIRTRFRRKLAVKEDGLHGFSFRQRPSRILFVADSMIREMRSRYGMPLRLHKMGRSEWCG